MCTSENLFFFTQLFKGRLSKQSWNDFPLSVLSLNISNGGSSKRKKFPSLEERPFLWERSFLYKVTWEENIFLAAGSPLANIILDWPPSFNYHLSQREVKQIKTLIILTKKKQKTSVLKHTRSAFLVDWLRWKRNNYFFYKSLVEKMATAASLIPIPHMQYTYASQTFDVHTSILF